MSLMVLIPWSSDRSLISPVSQDRDPLSALRRVWRGLVDRFTSIFRSRTVRPGLGARIDVIESGTEVKIAAELPGLDEENIQLSLHDGVLTIKGEKSGQTNAVNYAKRWHWQFHRSFRVGRRVDPDTVSARFKRGVLTVTMRKRAEPGAQVKRIPIYAA
jgi:HSP20 family protein